MPQEDQVSPLRSEATPLRPCLSKSSHNYPRERLVPTFTGSQKSRGLLCSSVTLLLALTSLKLQPSLARSHDTEQQCGARHHLVQTGHCSEGSSTLAPGIHIPEHPRVGCSDGSPTSISLPNLSLPKLWPIPESPPNRVPSPEMLKIHGFPVSHFCLLGWGGMGKSSESVVSIKPVFLKK